MEPMGATDIILFGIRLQEIDVIVTDLIWSIVCLVSFIRLTSMKAQLSEAGNWFRWMFLLMAVAVFLGAFMGHGFQYVLGHEGKYPGWIVSMWGVACMERSAIGYAGERVSKRLASIMSVANITELVLFHGLILYFGSFYLVEIHAAYGLIAIAFPLHFLVFRKTGSKASKYTLIGIVVAASAVVVHLTEFYIHPVWFNYHDVSHIILAIATYIYYLGAKEMVVAPAA
ncbi:MAG: hypothetical protein AB8F78_14565 [Saprospiraceae bacterium]